MEVVEIKELSRGSLHHCSAAGLLFIAKRHLSIFVARAILVVNSVSESMNSSRLSLISASHHLEQFLAELKAVVGSSKSIKELASKLVNAVENEIRRRPTSAALVNTSRRLLEKACKLMEASLGIDEVRARLVQEIDNLVHEYRAALEASARIASKRILDGDRVMTISFSLGVLQAIRKAIEDGKRFEVMVLESRPGGEGIELAKNLASMGVPTTLIVDSAARFHMKQVTRVLIGSEAVAANGAVVNKVGTSLLALAANEARVRVFVVAPTQKFSFETIHGELIEIPTLDPSLFVPKDLAELGVKGYAPLFDVTPPEYIDAIATERGFIAPQAVPFLLRELYGSWPPRVPELSELEKKLEEVVNHV